MATLMFGQRDEGTDAVERALEAYERDYAPAEAWFYRQNPGSIRVRIVDPRFERMTKGERHKEVYPYLRDRVTGDYFDEVSVLLLLPPSELESSFANFDFEKPLQSNL